MDTDAFLAFWSFLVVEVKYYHKVTLLDSCQVDISGIQKSYKIFMDFSHPSFIFMISCLWLLRDY